MGWFNGSRGRALKRRAGFGILLCGSFGFGLAYGSWTRACAGAACPSISVLEEYRPQQAAKVYAADGRLITELGVQRRTVLTIDEIAPEVRAAFLAVEDKRFYQHHGIDFWRVFGAIKANILALGWAQGFSTITMQLARNVWQDRIGFEKILRRKIREIKVALELERTYPKDKILELYLNQIYLGSPNLYGVEAAAQGYFGKSARELNVAEAALLAAIANLPGRYDPRKYPARAIRRRNLVISLMRDAGYLTEEEAARWSNYPLILSSRPDFGEVAPYFVEWIRQQLYDRFGRDLYEEGYRIYTTLDLEMQIAAERALEEQLEAIESGAYGPFRHPTYDDYLESLQNSETARRSHTITPYLQGALVALDARTGHVLAMVGGRDFGDSEFNRATQARRQAGSTFKPFVYAAAIRAGKPASYMVDDAPISLMLPGDSLPWEPQNYEGDFRGPMTLRRGLYLSRNLVAIRLGLEIGEQAVIGEALRFGISTPLPPYPSLHIGSASVIPLEMTAAFTPFATLGVKAAPIGILRVEDAKGNIVWEPQPRTERVMDEEHIWILTSMLQDVVDRGTAYQAVRGAGFTLPAAGKTGTTNDGTDVWFIGFTPELVAGVWIGFDEPKKIKANAAGGRLAAPAWTAFMKEVYERRPPPPPWRRPDGLITREIDATTGFLATEFCPRDARYWEWFIPGTEPGEFCPVHLPLRRGISVRYDR
ncbi:MAG: penicillin-binding protein [Gemmatimonadales bacterium]|nr:Penicillin-binding protein 1A [bacterium HR33]GIW51876.1 MAG: penicillin-binding protein [Gemmatimonadales bacterium]